MIQIGGLGFMSIAVILSLIIKRAVTPKERMLVAMSYNLDSYGNTSVLLKRIGIDARKDIETFFGKKV